MKTLPISVIVVEANFIIHFMFNTNSVTFRVGKLQEPSQLDDSPGLKAEGKFVAQDAEWIEVRPKPKLIPSKQIGKNVSKMDFGKVTGKPLLEKTFTASPASFPAKDLLDKMIKWLQFLGSPEGSGRV